jgi:tRNA A-37 threonylcarbamoyl transferase component Bud32
MGSARYRPGDRFGTYEIVQALGQGGEGIVYHAHDTVLVRDVALKVLSDERCRDASYVAQLLNEARMACQLDTPNAVRVYAVVEHDGQRGIAMELVPGGRSAYDWLWDNRTRLDSLWQTATRLVADACRGLIAAHKGGLTHRDIKPGNILLAPSSDGEFFGKLSDFGMARRGKVPNQAAGTDRAIEGTPQYMSPEQWRGDAGDGRSDIYSLGATYFNLLTGRPPFEAATILEMLNAHMKAPVPRPDCFPPKVPATCAEVVRRALAKEPCDRYQSAEEMLTALEDALQDALPAYLRWVIDCHAKLEIRGLRHGPGKVSVDLEKVYVALRGDRTNPHARATALHGLEQDVQAALAAGLITAEEIDNLRDVYLAESPLMPEIEFRDRPSAFSAVPEEVITLGEAYRQHRRLVILGAPGSGKTTLARWLALTMAKALLRGEQEVHVPREQVFPECRGDPSLFSLGRPRLPILIRVSAYAEDRRASLERKEPPRSLFEFLGLHGWLKTVPTYGDECPGRRGQDVEPEKRQELAQRYVQRGDALIILDGLDEVTSKQERDDIIRAVEQFLRDHVSRADQIVHKRSDGYFDLMVPPGGAERPGNRLVVTSRIVGYKAAPLTTDIPHVTVEPMSDFAVGDFIDAWMNAVHAAIRHAEGKDRAVQERAQKEASGLKRRLQLREPDDALLKLRAQLRAAMDARDEAAVAKLRKAIDEQSRRQAAAERLAESESRRRSFGRRGSRELITNPQLASTLAAVFHNRDQRLPGNRVELFEIAAEDLADIWEERDRGNKP